MNDGSGFILALFMPGLLRAALVGLWSLGKAPRTRKLDVSTTTSSPTAVSIWPYVLACYLVIGLVYVLLVAIKLLLWPAAPRVVSVSAPMISILVATWLFAKTNQRSLLSGEKWWFTLGCFAVFWIYDATHGLFVLLTRGNVSTREIVLEVFGAVVDFTLVWLIVTCCVAWARHYTAAEQQRRLTIVGGVRERR